MHDIDALHAAILAQPDDDTLRLVYADRLDESDAERAACDLCGGTGKVEAERLRCLYCRGTGQVKRMTRRGLKRTLCGHCTGTGRFVPLSSRMQGKTELPRRRAKRRETCDRCDGRGDVEDSYNRDVAELIRLQDTLAKQCLICAGAGWVRKRTQYDPKGPYVEPCTCDSDWRDHYTPLMEELDAKMKARNDLHKREHEILDQHWRSMISASMAPWWTVGWRCAYPPCPASSHEPATSLEFQRGFVDKLTVPLGVFEPYVAEVFSEHPIRFVTLSDRHPHPIDSRGTRRFLWHTNHADMGLPARPGSWISPEIAQLMIGDPEQADHTPATRYVIPFYDRGAAHRALSRACVTYGRGKAGLPEWKPV